MDRLSRYCKHGKRLSICRRHEDEAVVRDGLSYSPADMSRLTERGMPVNGLNTQQAFIEGEQNPSWIVDAERSRYVDVCDLWEQHMNMRDKARSAARASKVSKSKKS